MLTTGLAALAVLLLVVAAAVALLWRAAVGEVRAQGLLIRHQQERIDGYRAELDALSISGPRVDTTTGSHDRLPIRDDIRHTLIDYCEGMWHHTNGEVK